MLTPDNLPAVLTAVGAIIAAISGWGVMAGRREKKDTPVSTLTGDDRNAWAAMGAEMRELRREMLREMERAADDRQTMAADMRAMRESFHSLRGDHMAIMSALRIENRRNGDR